MAARRDFRRRAGGAGFGRSGPEILWEGGGCEASPEVAVGVACCRIVLSGALLIASALSPAVRAGDSAVDAHTMPAQTDHMLVLKPDETQPLGDGRTITLTDLVEKRLVPDRRSMMRARFRISFPGGAEPDRDVELTSDEPRVEADGLEIEYLGGWRSEAQIRVTFRDGGKSQP